MVVVLEVYLSLALRERVQDGLFFSFRKGVWGVCVVCGCCLWDGLMCYIQKADDHRVGCRRITATVGTCAVIRLVIMPLPPVYGGNWASPRFV